MSASRNTSHWFDFAALQEMVRQEKAVRQVTNTIIVEQTGLNEFSVSRFLGYDGTRVGIDAAISLCDWLGQPVAKFVRRRRSSRKHVDTPEQGQLRKANAYLNSLGVVLENGESPVDAMMRIIAEQRGQA